MVKFILTSFAICAVSLAGAVGQQPALPPPAPVPAATPETPAPIEPPTQPAQAPQISPAIPTATTPAGEPAVTGSGVIPITATEPSGRAVNEFQGDDVAQVLRLLARQAKINIVVSDKVDSAQMKITMRLEDKTPLEAIKVIALAKGLTVDENEGVYYVKTKEEKEQEPTETANYTLSYAAADKILPLLAGQLASHAAPQFDQRTNTIFYRETKSNLKNIKTFLDTIDKPTRQVMIEARLVEVNANPRQAYGLNWGGVFGSSASPKVFKYGGVNPGTQAVVNAQKVTTNADGSITTQPLLDANGVPIQAVQIGSLPQAPTASNGQFNPVDFLFQGAGNNFFQSVGGQFAILSAPQMSVTLRLLNEDADAEFIANPRIVTANNMVANIKITRNQPVPTLDFNAQTATAVFSGFQDKTFGSTLSVTPIINKDNFISLNVKPEISNKVGDQTFNFQGANVSSPIIDTRTLESNVLIKSGDTLAIGGLLQDETSKQRTKVPVAGDIPVLGYLFQERINARTKRNLLVFVTPTIIKQGYGTGLEDQAMGLHDSTGEEVADPNGWRNNAKGSIRLVPTSHAQNVTQYPPPSYPRPGTPLDQHYKGDASSREE